MTKYSKTTGQNASDDLVAAIEEAIKEEQRKRLVSPTIISYCDLHIATKIAPAVSLGSVEHEYFGEARASANSTDLW
jgi:hypothetical protein